MYMEKPIILEQQSQKEGESIGNNLDDFEILQTLGKGSYGFVAKVKSKINEKLYAMKMIDFSLIHDQTEKDLCLNEIEIIKKLDNPHIIKYYKSFQIKDKFYILMEYMDNGDMKGYIAAHQNMGKPIPEEELWDLFYQCMSGLICIHKNKLIHRDIKPANLFLTNNKTIKIGDFGVSASRKPINTPNGNNNEKAEKQTMMIGTPLYMSPEMFLHEKYGVKVDIYSLGCSFYEMCYFTPPRLPVPKMTPNFEIITDLQDIPIKTNQGFYSKDITELIEKMIKKNQNERGRDDDIFDIIKKNYYSKCKININTSINAVYRCLLSIKKFSSYLNRHHGDINGVNKPITLTFSLANKELTTNNGKNWDKELKNCRTILTYNNTSFIDPGEIEPEDLIEYILKTIHIECRKLDSPYTRIYSVDNDPDIFDRQKIYLKYLTNFKSFLQSVISDLFFGTLEIKSFCPGCRSTKYFFENFLYLIIDIKEAINNGISPNDQNFIYLCFQRQSNSQLKRSRVCLKCNNNKIEHTEKKNYTILPKNLIILFRNEVQNIFYPQFLDLSGMSPENSNAKYNLKSVINKSNQKKKVFTCLYEGIQQNSWLFDDGNQSQLINSPYLQGNLIVALIYSQG